MILKFYKGLRCELRFEIPYLCPKLKHMQIKRFPTYQTASEWIARQITNTIRQKPNLLLATPSGRTPQLTYQLLGQTATSTPSLFRRLQIVQLDEWGGLSIETEGSCISYLQQYVLHPLGITRDRYLGFDGKKDLEKEASRVAKKLADKGAIDICFLGLGTNGHIGFIEPADVLQPHAHVVTLQPSTQQHKMIESVATKPTHGLTLGIVDIFKAKKVFIFVAGDNKQAAYERFMTKTISTQFPASLLWLHSNVTCVIDEMAIGSS